MMIFVILASVIGYIILAGAFSNFMEFKYDGEKSTSEVVETILWPLIILAFFAYLLIYFPYKFGRYVAKKLKDFYIYLDEKYDIRK